MIFQGGQTGAFELAKQPPTVERHESGTAGNWVSLLFPFLAPYILPSVWKEPICKREKRHASIDLLRHTLITYICITRGVERKLVLTGVIIVQRSHRSSIQFTVRSRSFPTDRQLCVRRLWSLHLFMLNSIC